MNALLLLAIIFALLLLLITGKTGLRNLLGLLINLGAIFLLMLLISWHFNALLVVLIISILILSLAIFMSSSDEAVTTVAFKSSVIVVLGLFLLAVLVQTMGQFQGFSSENADALEELSLSVGLNYPDIAIVVMLISMLGAVAEASMALVADLSEVIEQDEKISLPQLKAQRLIISQQILGTAVNTLFFGMLGASVGLVLWYIRLRYTLSQILNSKLLMADTATMLLGMLAILLTIWLSGHYVIIGFKKEHKLN